MCTYAIRGRQFLHIGLCRNAYETHRRPSFLPLDKVYITASVTFKAPSGTIYQSELNGCVLKSAMANIGSSPEDSEEDHEEVLTWYGVLTDLLPGPKFSKSRKDIMEWWRIVTQVSDINNLQNHCVETKVKFLMYAKKLSECYQNAIARGVESDKGRSFMDEASKWKTQLKLAGAEVSSHVLSRLFDAGDISVTCIPEFIVWLLLGIDFLLPSVMHGSAKNRRDTTKRITETKQICTVQFERSIEDFITYVGDHETAAWNSFEGKMSQLKAQLPLDVDTTPSTLPIMSTSVSPDGSPCQIHRKNRRYSVLPLEKDCGGTERHLVRSRSSASILASSLSAFKLRLTKRLDLVKQQRIHQDNFQFLATASQQFRLCMFEFKVREEMTAYMDRECAELQEKMKAFRSDNFEKLNLKHAKEKAKAITDGVFDRDEAQIAARQEAQTKKLDMKVNDRVHYREQRFQDSRTRTMEKLETKMRYYREKMSESILSGESVRLFKNMLRVYGMVKDSSVL